MQVNASITGVPNDGTVKRVVYVASRPTLAMMDSGRDKKPPPQQRAVKAPILARGMAATRAMKAEVKPPTKQEPATAASPASLVCLTPTKCNQQQLAHDADRTPRGSPSPSVARSFAGSAGLATVASQLTGESNIAIAAGGGNSGQKAMPSVQGARVCVGASGRKEKKKLSIDAAGLGELDKRTLEAVLGTQHQTHPCIKIGIS